MAAYNIFFKKSVEKDFSTIPKKDLKKIIKRIGGLAKDPRPPGCEKLPGQERYRLRQGRYRIVSSIQDDELTVRVVKAKNKSSGFTLIELVIVIVLMGILFATAIPMFINMMDEARIASNKTKMGAVRTGIDIIYAMIMVSGRNTGIGGSNPDWPTFEEVKANELLLETRPNGIRYLQIVRSFDSINKSINSSQPDDIGSLLPACNLPDMTTEMANNPTGVTLRTLAQATANPRVADESTCWAYYPGTELNSRGRAVGPIFYINDDRSIEKNLDPDDRIPSEW